MEQKTEASQAVQEQSNIRRWQDRLPEGVSFSYGYAHIAAMKAEIADLRAALKAQPAPTEAAQGEDSARLGDGYKSSTMVSDFYGAGKVTIHYETARQAESAHNSLVIMFNRASAETGGVKP